jgi:hypothetical protein
MHITDTYVTPLLILNSVNSAIQNCGIYDEDSTRIENYLPPHVQAARDDKHLLLLLLLQHDMFNDVLDTSCTRQYNTDTIGNLNQDAICG